MIDTLRVTVLVLATTLAGGCDRAAPDPHAGHDHATDAGPGPSDPRAGENSDADAGRDHGDTPDIDDGHDHDDAGDADAGHTSDAAEDATAGHDHAVHADAHVELTSEQQTQLGLRLATAGPGRIEITTTFPGEVILDPNRMAHIVPRAAGIVREVQKSVGAYVEAEEVLAWIESDELAEAKLAFYAKHAEVACCRIELPRAKEILESTNKLLALLEQEPTAEQLRQLDTLEMGEHRGKLVTAYAEYLATKNAFDRERGLFQKSISSESEFIAAESTFRKAHAGFTAAKDVARYQVRVAYSETARKRQVAEFEAVAAEQRLRLKGVDDDTVARLMALVPRTGGIEPCLCEDAECEHDRIPSVMETLGDEQRLGWYPLRAPFAGFITEKHLTLGEKVGGEASVLTIADTSSVWVRFNVYQKNLLQVRPGQAVRVEVGANVAPRTGTITYLAPTVDRATRTALARVELANPDGVIRPGLYAIVHVSVEPVDGAIVVRKDAVQVVGETEVVFVPEDGGFVPVPVRLGRSDRERVIVLAGLAPGERYVERGAFELKAKIVTEGADAHAGHGH